jgi:hypothetical protein
MIIPIPSHTHRPIPAPSDIRCYTYVVLTTSARKESKKQIIVSARNSATGNDDVYESYIFNTI